MKDKLYYIIFVIIISYYMLFNIYTRPSVENLEIPSYVSIDFIKNENIPIYQIDIAAYVFEDNKIKYIFKEGMGKNVIDARTNRQLTENKEYVVGQEQAYIINEKVARGGIIPFFDTFFMNNLTNDDALVVISKQKASDIVKHEIEKQDEVTNYLEKILKTIDSMSFYSKRNSVFDVYSKLDSKIRTLVLPYIEITKQGIEITGTAIFKNGKMNAQIDLEQSTILNMLNENSGNGILALQENTSKGKENKYIDLYGKPKRKVKCWKENNKLNFLIEIIFNGEMVTNSLNPDSEGKSSTKKETEYAFEKQIESMSKKFISKMQTEYKIDCINLSRVAAAKYGKSSEEDWDKAICNSNIFVKAKVNIKKQGRGGY